jgi:hypothetical protein
MRDAVSKVFRFISLRYANNIIIMKNDKQFVLRESAQDREVGKKRYRINE